MVFTTYGGGGVVPSLLSLLGSVCSVLVVLFKYIFLCPLRDCSQVRIEAEWASSRGGGGGGIFLKIISVDGQLR